jgi:hypothetical protein
MRKFLVVATLVVSIGMLLPMSALAYLSPDQVFGNSGAPVQPPPTQREGEAVIQEQQQRSAELRNAAQESLVPNYSDPQDTYDAAASSTAEPLGLFDDNTQYERRMDRINESNANAPTIIIGGNGTVVDAKGNILHSGAPIASTGPESVLAVFVVILAGICTFAYSGIRQRQLSAVA